MDRVEILDSAESLFKEAGFYLSRRCCTRPSCFDFVARKDSQLTFLKAHQNIGNIYEKAADELATIAKLFSGSPLLICEKSRSKPLEDDTVYSRYNIGAVTINTLEDALTRGMGPLIEAGPGGYYVRLDGEAIRKRRLKKGASIGKMAKTLGISRRTLYGYERGMAKASVSTAYKLEWFLGIPIVKPIDIFVPSQKTDSFLAIAKRMISESRFLQFVTKKLLQFNFTVFQVNRAPFDFVAKTPENKINLLGTIAYEKEGNLEVRTDEVISISKIIDAQPLFVADSKNISTDGVPLIHREDLEKIKCPEDLIAKL
ncbi:MAG: transcriptional regulator [Candidatus Bathyarchaeota archaeon]|nr:MAG: transcriptional regulator [Candidatus Bathyarchaeota archaeon]